MTILSRDFYSKEIVATAKNLLGKILVYETPEGITAGRIVETEAYLGPEDQAAHSSGGRRTARNDAMYGEKGHAYVYFIYGLYFCLNVTAGEVTGKPEAVLLRALEPIEGQELMAKRRGININLTNGPSRLCMAMGINKSHNRSDLTSLPLYIKDATPIESSEIIETKRIGVDYAGEWKNKPLRFYINSSSFVSVK
jgi:DNA-3-methyladenine glycosylase